MVGFFRLSVFLHSRFGLHTVFGCQRSCGLYDLSVSLFLKLRKPHNDAVEIGGLEPPAYALQRHRSPG